MNKTTSWLVSVLSVLLTGLVGWNLKETHNSIASLRELAQRVNDGRDARMLASDLNTKEHEKVFQLLDGLVGRREFDVKIADINAELVRIKSDILNLQLRMAALTKTTN